MNLFINNQYDNLFNIDNVKIGSVLRIRLPIDYHIIDRNILTTPALAPSIVSIKEVAILGTASLIIKNPEVTRRFWNGWFK